MADRDNELVPQGWALLTESGFSFFVYCLAIVYMFSVSQFKVNALGCPLHLQRNVLLFSLDFACLKTDAESMEKATA